MLSHSDLEGIPFIDVTGVTLRGCFIKSFFLVVGRMRGYSIEAASHLVVDSNVLFLTIV